jgi:hypothetical protein
MDIFGALGLPDTDYAFVNTIGQAIVYDATLQVLGDHNADLAASEAVFVEGTTWDHTIKYKLPSEGFLQRKTARSEPALTKPNGGWTCSFTLEEFGAGVGWDRVSLAYATMGQFNLVLEGVKRKDRNTRRQEMLRALFNNANRVFFDENFPTLSISPLANGDSVVYPPVIGSQTEATANNYLVSGYAPSAISDANDPIPVLVNQLEQYLGTPTGGSKIAVFCNNEETPFLKGLTNFDAVPNRFVAYGENVSLVPRDRYPAGLPGRILGETDSALIVEWRWVPAGYLLAVHLDAPSPLRRRIDPPAVGLGEGLTLTTVDHTRPIEHSTWTNRFGYGCANRLNGCVMQLTTNASYTPPALYNY